MRKSLKALDNPLRLRTNRRDYARIETVLNEDVKGISKLAEQAASVLGETDAVKKNEEKGE